LGEERDQAEDAHELELELLRLVGHPFREAMEAPVKRADPEYGGDQEDAHDHHQRIDPAHRREIERQMMRGHWMELLVQWSLSKLDRVLCRPPRHCDYRSVELLDLNQGTAACRA
jgi:hypothetical protein